MVVPSMTADIELTTAEQQAYVELLRTDEMRRNIEDLGPGVYTELGYYERWCAAISNVLLQKKVISVDELGRKMAEVEERWTKARKS